MYIVELEAGVWLAPWSGDPGRTCNIDSALTFECYQKAEYAIVMARCFRPFENAKVIKQET